MPLRADCGSASAVPSAATVSRCTSLTSSRFSVCSCRSVIGCPRRSPVRHGAPPDPRSLDVRGGERLAVARAGFRLLRPSSRHGNLDDVQTRPRAGPRDGSSFHQAAGQPPDVAPLHGPIVQLLDAHVDVPVAARQSCWCTCPWMFTQPGGSPSRLPTSFPSMPASCAAFDCRGRAPTMSVAAGCASVTGRPPPPRPECS